MKKGLTLEFLDVVQLARPGLLDIDPRQTAAALDARETAFMSYNASFAPLDKAHHALLSEETLKAWFTDTRPWVRRSQWEVSSALANLVKLLGAEWYNVGRRPFEAIPGLWLKPSIRGVLVGDEVAPAIVNPRRSLKQIGRRDELGFLMRGGFEFHVVDDPAVDNLLVLDLHEGERGRPRVVRSRMADEAVMMPLEQFEWILGRFFEALRLSKWEIVVPKDVPLSDLFRKKK